ncbi:hypothetical protein F4604DRAFT_1915976 [Suillus subluteus]|nr:hypothetical protein F4604DRAFT_1915976 [Suillus subluteus]
MSKMLFMSLITLVTFLKACALKGTMYQVLLSMHNHSQSTTMVVFTILDGLNPGIVDTYPFMAASMRETVFPLVVTCEPTKQAQHVLTSQPFLSLLSQQVLPTSVTDTLLQSQALKAIFSHHTPFYPVVYGRNVGIYLSWEAALQEVNGQQVWKFKKMMTFIKAIEFMLTRGNTSTPAQLTLLPLHAAVSPLTPSYLKFESMLTRQNVSTPAHVALHTAMSPMIPSYLNLHVSSRATVGTVPPLHKQTQSVTDTADVLSTLSLNVGDSPQPSVLKPTKPEPRNIYCFI